MQESLIMKYNELRFILTKLGLDGVQLPSDELFDVIFTLRSQNQQPGKNYECYEFFGDAVLKKLITKIIFDELNPCAENKMHCVREPLLKNQGPMLLISRDQLKLHQYLSEDIRDCNLSDKRHADLIEALLGLLDMTIPTYQSGCLEQFVKTLWKPYIDKEVEEFDKKAAVSQKKAMFSRMKRRFITCRRTIASDQNRLLSFITKSEKEFPLEKFKVLLEKVNKERLVKIWCTPFQGTNTSLAKIVKEKQPEKVAYLKEYLELTSTDLNYISDADHLASKKRPPLKTNWEKIKTKLASQEIDISKRQVHLLSLLRSSESEVPITEFQELLKSIGAQTIDRLWNTPNSKMGFSSPSKMRIKRVNKKN